MRCCVLPWVPVTVHECHTRVRNVVCAILVDNFDVWWLCDIEGCSADVALVFQIKSAGDQRQHIVRCVSGLEVAPFCVVVLARSYMSMRVTDIPVQYWYGQERQSPSAMLSKS